MSPFPRRKTARGVFALSLLAACMLPASSFAAAPLGFIDEQPVRNDLSGSLQGTIKFAQTHTIDAAGNPANELPTLVAKRGALVMFIPQTTIAETRMGHVKVTAMRAGEVLGERLLAPPRLLPDADRSEPDHRPDVVYSRHAWSAQLPWEWMQPGLSLSFSDGRHSGTLSEQALEFTGPAELVLQNIRIGMLTAPPPASGNWLETDTARAAIDYFQKVPVARLTVGHYLPVHLDRVVLANGTTYTTASAVQGSVYSGDMREDIGKALISVGINMANYGIVDSAGRSHTQPGHFRQVVIHQNIGRYANGDVRHGLSGGNGMATLLSTSGNEFTHELGHTFGLGHYPGGGYWSSHHNNSGWGYDAFRNRLLGNVHWSKAATNNVIDGVVTPPFNAHYRYRQDPMAGGEPDGSISALTHHTGYSMRRVQEALVASSIVDAGSPTGYSHWDAGSNGLVATEQRNRPALIGVPVVTLVGLYDPLGQLPTTLYPPLYGNHGHTYNLPAPAAGNGCYLSVRTEAGTGRRAEDVTIRLASSRHQSGEMNKYHVNVPASSAPSAASLFCHVDGELRKLAEQRIDTPTEVLPPVVQVGHEAGFANAALHLADIQASVTRRFASTDEFEQRLRALYGDIHKWRDARTGRVGDFYVYQNPYSGFREYFMLKKPRYGYFPTDGTSDDAWRYMGRAEDHVTWSPEPLRARKVAGASLSEKLLAYYDVPSLKDWQMHDATVKPGQIYEYHNPYTKTHEFFMAKSSWYWYFPIDGRSNAHWTYLGNAQSLQEVFAPVDAASFERQLLDWYKQPALRTWGVPNNAGTIGDLYRYAYAGRVDYFRLKNEGYWYFPTDKTSNWDWEYLGSWE